jgi:hypothetical protein
MELWTHGGETEDENGSPRTMKRLGLEKEGPVSEEARREREQQGGFLLLRRNAN